MWFITGDWWRKFGVGTALWGPHSTSSVQENHWNLEPHRTASFHTKIHIPKSEERELFSATTLILRTEMLPFHLLSLSLTPEYIYISPILIMTTISNISLEILTQEKDNALLPHQESMTFHTRAGRSSLLPRLNKFSVEIIVEMQSFSWFNCCWHADLTALASWQFGITTIVILAHFTKILAPGQHIHETSAPWSCTTM